MQMRGFLMESFDIWLILLNGRKLINYFLTSVKNLGTLGLPLAQMA